MSSLAAILPVDVLYHIFEMYCSEAHCFPQIKLSQVCRHWRYASLDFARLWNNFSISYTTPITAISLYLQRSRGTPLTLDCDLRRLGRDLGARSDDQRVTLIWKLVIAQATCWQDLSLKFDKLDADTIIPDLARVYTPLLERLLLWTDSPITSDTPLFERCPLNLDTLSLKGVHLHQFSSNAIHVVKRLELSTSNAIPLKDFRDAISKMRCLEHLSLHGNVVAEWPAQLGEEVIELPTLRSLELSGQGVAITIPLLSISAPMLLEITLVDITAQDLITTSVSSHFRYNFPSVGSIALAGILTEVDDVTFRRLFRLFPDLDHLALIQVSEFLTWELNCVLQQQSLWPQLQAIFATDCPEGQNIIVSKHTAPCGWEDAHMAKSACLTRSDWLGGCSADAHLAVDIDHEIANALRYLLGDSSCK